MPEVVEQGGEANHLPPGRQRFTVWKEVHDVRVAIALVGDDVEDSAGQLHHTQRVLEPPMGRARVDEIRQRELVNVPEPLKWAGVDRRDLVGCDADEVMNRVADLVLLLRHCSSAS